MTWTVGTAAPVTLFGPCAVGYAGKVYVFGTDTTVATVYIYDPGTDTWTTGTSSPWTIFAGAAVAIGTSIYVVDYYATKMFIYDPAGDSWVDKTSGIPAVGTGTRTALVGCTDGTKLYLLVKQDAISDSLPAGRIYDPGTDTWDTTTIGKVPSSVAPNGVEYGTLAFIGGELIFANGEGQLGSAPDGVVGRFNFGTGAWTAGATDSNPAEDYPTSIQGLSVIVTIGGDTNTATDRPTVRIYDPAADAWTAYADLNVSRTDAGAAVCGGRLYVIGGSSGGSDIASVEWAPATDFVSTGGGGGGGGGAAARSQELYVFLLSDTTSGKNLGELPLEVSGPIVTMLNGAGQWSGTFSADDPMAADSFLGVGVSSNIDREVTVYRDGVPVWNGPVIAKAGNLRSRQVTLTMAEPFWFLTQRILEWDSSNLWSATSAVDLFNIIRALFTYAVSKDSTGTTSGGSNINAAIPRFVVDPTAGTLAGVTKTLSYPGTDRRLISDIIMDLVKDPTTGLDFRNDYSIVSGLLQRTLTLSSPSLGSTIAGTIVEDDLYDFDKNEDLTRAANRVHAVGQGYVDTEQNTGSVASGDILREARFDTDLTDVGQIQAFALDARRRSQPPVTNMVFTYIPTPGGLDFGFCTLGDRVNLGITGPSILHSEGHVRIVQKGMTPGTATSPELMQLTAELPLDQLGT